MQRHPFGQIAAIPRDKLLWPVLATLVLGQLVAFWMLCSHQVRKAEVRNATLQVQRVAVADCLRYIPRATLAHCVQRVDPNSRAELQMAADGATAAGRAAMSSAVPVNYVYR
jgi:hypothetical protein